MNQEKSEMIQAAEIIRDGLLAVAAAIKMNASSGNAQASALGSIANMIQGFDRDYLSFLNKK